jgi:mono/diheme cytochrome c family protein
MDEANQPQAAATVSLWAARYAGAAGGTLKCTTCHAPEANLWKTTRHATFLQNLLNGAYQTTYDTNCLACHAVGAFADTRGDNNFLDAAETVSFDLTQIKTWVEDAVATGNQNYTKLPLELQTLAGVQCESCHGPGDTHRGNAARIAPGELSGRVCAVCHDGTGEYVRFAQWENSGHIRANTSAGGAVATNAGCVACHTAEGFVELVVRGKGAIDAKYADRHSVTCSACHDSHDPARPALLRTVSPVSLPNQSVYDRGAGNLCANCHHSRIASPDDAVDLVKGSYRGAHHGPQTDIFLGTSAYTWGNPYPAGVGLHYGLLDTGCVACHAAKAPEPSSTVGDHTFQINNPRTGVSTVPTACGGCHAGLTTTDRVPLGAQDYDGNGAAEGSQTETRGILENLKKALEEQIPSLSWSDTEKRLSIANADWQTLTLDQRAALYNFNLISEDKSEGIHNTKYSLAVLQRSYFHLTGTVYADAFPNAVMVDDDLGVTTNLPAPRRISASDGFFTDRIEVTWDSVERPTHYRVFRSLSPSDPPALASDWITTTPSPILWRLPRAPFP